jgi:prepilin-type N-terminal cleavage/methylation domain-containing protein
MTSTTTNRGFSLLEIGVVIVIILILAAMLAPIMGGLVDVDRSTKASAELERIYRAIVGNPAAGNFGYLGDVGDYPTSLIDLVQDNGLDGWDGPYLTDVYVENGIVYDSLGSPIEYYHEAFDTGVNDLLAIISKGPDRVSTNLQENPNLSPWSALAGLLPTSAAYFMDSQNLDNLEYPRFSDNAGLARYNSVGTLGFRATCRAAQTCLKSA